MRWIIRLIGVLVLLAVIFVGALLLLPGDRIAAIAAQQIKVQTGRDLTISGDVKISLFPVIGVRTGPIALSNADWAGDAPMFEAQSAAISVETSSLFGGPVVIKGIEADTPQVRLARDAQGRGNWEFGEAAEETTTDSTEGSSRQIALEMLKITDAAVRFDDNGAVTEVKNVDVTLDWDAGSGRADFEIAVTPANQEVTVNGSLDNLQGFLDGQVQGMSVTAKTLGGTVTANGRASMAGEFAGKTDVALDKPDAFMAALGQAPLNLGSGLNFTGDVTMTADQRLSIRGGQAQVMGNTVSLDADVTLGDVPYVNAKLNAAALDLSRFASGGGASTDAGAAGWSKAPIDASGLSAFNGEIGLVTGAVKYGDITLGKTRLLLTVDRARAVFDLREIQAFEGVLSGEFVMNNRGGLSVGGGLIAQKMALQPMLAATAGVDRLSGPMDAEVKFLASGQSVHQLMNALSGNGAVKLGQGTIRGINLDALMKTGSGTGNRLRHGHHGVRKPWRKVRNRRRRAAQ